MAAIICFTVPVSSVAASGLGVSPAELDLEGEKAELSDTLTISNPTAGVLLVEVYPDSFDRKVQVEPSSFILASGEEQITEVTVNSSDDELITTNISVVSQPLAEGERTLGAATGVKIPLRAQITDQESRSFIALVSGSLTNAQDRVRFGVGLITAGLVLLVLLVVVVRYFRKPTA